MTQGKMQVYMDRHKLGPLFEDMMNRVVRDMPEEPLVYLLRTLYKKAGMEIPQDIRYGGLRKSVDVVRSRSPERASRMTGQATVDPTSTSASREYNKPWQTHQRRMKPRRSAEDPESGKGRPEWQGDTKVLATSFDDLWTEKDGHSRDASPLGKKSRAKSDPRLSWAAVGLEGGDAFTSGVYLGPSRQPQGSEEELLAGEIMRSLGRDNDEDVNQSAQAPESTSRVRGQRCGRQQRGERWGEEDEALELLENAEDLQREGVKNIPAAGYKLSKIMRERTNESVVKLNINVSPRGGGMRVSDSMQSLEGYESDRENASPAAGRWGSEEEFESVSQVTGPRRPVWNVPDSDAESAVVPSSKKRHRSHQQGRRDLVSTARASLHKVALTPGDLDLPVNQTWSPGLRREDSSPEVEVQGSEVTTARSGGWVVPDDSDAASVQDWNQRVKGRKRDPRSY
ncbi:hypothetical protein ACOMHN_051759 [Nucella lapillus]